MFQNGTTLPMDDFTGAFRALLSGEDAERRRERRRRSLKGAIVRFNNSLIAREAVVRDMTETGARLKVMDAWLLPEKIRFQFNGEANSRAARVVWRERGEAGVSFE